MSAVVRWDAPIATGPGRRHLRAVPTGPQARGGGASVGVRVDPTGARLTARGRRVLAVTLAAGLALGAGAAARAWAATPAAPARTIVVQSGQTLSGVAHRAYPSMVVSDAVTKVALANDLNGVQITAGQRLELPR